MIKVAPSILSADFSSLGAEVARVEQAGADMLHIDVMDNHFVPNLTIGPLVVASLRPHTRLFFDVHLMVERPETLVNPFIRAGANSITVHVESNVHLHRLVHSIKEQGIQCGVSLNPATPISVLEDILPDLDLVLLMSVNPGFGGQEFIPGVVGKIKALHRIIKEKGYKACIQVDGGINDQTAPLVVDAGAGILVAGSYIFNSPDVTETIRCLKNIK